MQQTSRPSSPRPSRIVDGHLGQRPTPAPSRTGPERFHRLWVGAAAPRLKHVRRWLAARGLSRMFADGKFELEKASHDRLRDLVIVPVIA
jgi:hypothetical protein